MLMELMELRELRVLRREPLGRASRRR
jgi:hypothetical protein